jgi:hypothetical protein
MFHKWRPRAKVGVYLGQSPQHARSVALVLSLETGLVSPQFHVSFDSSFQTVISTASEPNVPSHWQALAGLQEETSPTVELPSPEPSDGTSLPYIDAPLPSKAGSVDFLHLENDSPHEMGVPTVHTEPPVDSTPALPSVKTASSAAPLPVRPIHPSPVRHNTCPQRERRPVQRLIESMSAVTSDDNVDPTTEILSLQAMFPDEVSTIWDHPLMAYATSSNPDTLYYHEAMKAPDAPEFLKAMQEEVNGQMDNEVYELILRSELPEGATVLPAVWAM